MICGGCAGTVRYMLEDVPGVVHAHVNVGTATVTYDPLHATDAMLQNAVLRAGFVPRRLFRTGHPMHEIA
jgi:copper chaperone CopZ